MPLQAFLTVQNFFLLFLIIIFFLFWLFAFIILYHLIRFGIGTFPNKIAFIFFAGSIILSFCTALLFIPIDFDKLKDKLITFVSTAYTVNK